MRDIVFVSDPLHVYLRNHWTGACIGLDTAERVVGTHDAPELRRPLADVTRQIREDRDALREVMAAVDATPDVVFATVARVGERVARLKPNGRLLRRSPVSDVLELEALISAVTGKRAGWQALLTVSRRDPRLPAARLEELIRRAEDQLAQLAEVHRVLADRCLADS